MSYAPTSYCTVALGKKKKNRGKQSLSRIKAGLWTGLDRGLDRGLDCGLQYGLNSGLIMRASW